MNISPDDGEGRDDLDDTFEEVFADDRPEPEPVETPDPQAESQPGEQDPEQPAPQQDAAESDKHSERDYKVEYENIQKALRAERAQAKADREKFESRLGRVLERFERPAEPERQEADPLAGMPQRAPENADPLARIAALEAREEWLNNQIRANALQAQQRQQETDQEARRKSQNEQYFQAVGGRVMEAAATAGVANDQVAAAFNAVLNATAAPFFRLYQRQGYDQQQAAEFARETAQINLYEDAERVMSQGGDVIGELMKSARASGWAPPQAANGQAQQRQDPQPNGDDRAQQRQVLATSMSGRGGTGRQNGQLGVAELVDLSDDDFDAYFDRMEAASGFR